MSPVTRVIVRDVLMLTGIAVGVLLVGGAWVCWAGC
jgi:hypothetical protein